MKKALSVFLCLLLFASVLSVGVSAAETGASGSFTAFCYNVAGLPDISAITGEESRDVPANQTDIGNYVSAQKYDIFAAQEDFGYHDNLAAALPAYQYQTFHHGIVPFGDGTNTFTRSFPMYNEQHIVWNRLYGVVDDGADEFSQKGITYTVIEIAEGVYLDFYNIHADAYGDPGSVAARTDNFRQLADLINNRAVDRPVIVTGDFNAFVFNDSSRLKEILVDGCGLKDAWVETKNNGNYDDCSEFTARFPGGWQEKWGVWDSVERFMYKDGAGVSLSCDSFAYVQVLNRSGKSASDHNAALAGFTYTVTGDVPTGELKVTDTGFVAKIKETFRRIVVFFRKLMFGLQNLDKVKAYFDKGGEG